MSQQLITPAAARLHLSPTLAINELVLRTRATGKTVIHLGFGEATFPIPKDVLKAHVDASSSTSYLPVAGLQVLRKSIAQYNSQRLGIQIDESQVIIGPGSKPLLFTLFDIMEGDVLLPRPSWVSYEPQVHHAQKRLFWVETDEHDRHTITTDALEAAYAKSTSAGNGARIMLINSPSNPTGKVFGRETLLRVASFCASKRITLISDDIYSDLCFDPTDLTNSCFASASFNLETPLNVIMTGGLSKTYSAGGWRVGYAIFPATELGNALLTTTLAYASECWSAASAPAQEAATLAFSTSMTMNEYRTRVRAVHKYCTTKLYSALKALGLAVSEPQGGFYVYPSYHPFTKELHSLGVQTSANLSKWLIQNFGIAALPGSAFGEEDGEQGLAGGKLRLRMATSYLYFADEVERYREGYRILDAAGNGQMPQLPLLDVAISALTLSVKRLEQIRTK